MQGLEIPSTSTQMCFKCFKCSNVLCFFEASRPCLNKKIFILENFQISSLEAHFSPKKEYLEFLLIEEKMRKKTYKQISEWQKTKAQCVMCFGFCGFVPYFGFFWSECEQTLRANIKGKMPTQSILSTLFLLLYFFSFIIY